MGANLQKARRLGVDRLSHAMATPRILELQEAHPRYLPHQELSDDLCALIQKSRIFDLNFTFDENGNLGRNLTARSVVGQVAVGRDLIIRITPKVPIRNLFGMLELAYNLKSFRLGEGLVDIGVLDELYERLAAILARRVLDRARRGLYRSYVEHADSLGYLRGRLDVRATARLLSFGSPTMHCEFQEHTTDIDDNRILAWTLHLLCRTPFQRLQVREDLRAAYRAIDGAASLRPMQTSDCIGRIYNRLNEDYQPLHALCRLFLDGVGPGVERGEHAVIPYTVHMPRLFESFVAQWLNTRAPDRFQFCVQHTLNLAATEPNEWTVDMLVKDRATRRPIAVLDTKYKPHYSPSGQDIQQAVAYAVECGVKRAFLIYPSSTISRSPIPVGPVLVTPVHMDLSGDLEMAGQSLLRQLDLDWSES